MRGIARFIAFYNTEQPHSTLRYKTPEQAEQDYWLNLKHMRIPGSELTYFRFYIAIFDFSFWMSHFYKRGRLRKVGLNPQFSE